MKSTIGTIASALFVILGSLVLLFAQGPVQQQREFVEQGQQLLREGELPNGLALYRQTLQTSPDSLVAMLAPASSQTVSFAVASAQGEVKELRVAVLLAPPMVMEQNGSLTGFSIDLWNAIATRLKVKTSYQIMPDVRALEEVLRSKGADLTPAMFITSTRDADFDFRIQHLSQACKLWCEGLAQTERTPSRISPVLEMVRPAVFANDH